MSTLLTVIMQRLSTLLIVIMQRLMFEVSKYSLLNVMYVMKLNDVTQKRQYIYA